MDNHTTVFLNYFHYEYDPDMKKIKSKIKVTTFALLLLGGVLFEACNQEAQGFVLPEGDAEVGRATFLALECNQCHSVEDIAWQGEASDTEIRLGGTTTSIKTYGELVTSIINPSHRIASRYLGEKVMNEQGQSKMEIYNEVMTVQELVDLVTFLKSTYRITTPPNPYYY